MLKEKVRSRSAIVKRILVIAGVCFVVLVAGATWFLHSGAFRTWALHQLIDTAQERTGMRVQIQTLDLSLYPFIGEIRGVTVHGNEGSTAKPLFQADRIRVAFQLRPLLHKDIRIQQILIDRPEISLRYDARGSSNLQLKQSTSSSSFHFEIAQAMIKNGVIDYGDERVPVSADLYGLEATLNKQFATKSYTGSLKYELGRITAKDYRTLEHTLSARFTVDENHCNLDTLQVKARNSEVRLSADISDFHDPVVTGQYEANVEGQDLAFLLRDPSLPAGLVRLEGTLRYANGGTTGFLNGTYLDGTLQSSELRVSSAGQVINARKVYGKYQLERGLLKLNAFQASVLGGALRSNESVIDLTDGSGGLQAHLVGAQLQQLRAPVETVHGNVRILSVANVDFDARWQHGFSNATYHVKASLRNAPRQNPRPQDISASGALDLTYQTATGQLLVKDSLLKADGTQLQLYGELSKSSALNVQLTTADLHKLVRLVSVFAPSVQDPALDSLRGSASFSGRITGQLQNPNAIGTLHARQLFIRGVTWNSLDANLVASPNVLKIDNLKLASEQAGRVQGSVHIPLDHWSLDHTRPLSAQADLQSLSLAALQKSANTNYPVQGLLAGNIRLTGSIHNPSGNGHIQLTKAVVYGQPLTQLQADLETQRTQIRVAAHAIAPAGKTNAQLSYDLQTRSYTVKGDATGIDLTEIKTPGGKTQDADGKLNASFSGQGTLDNPQITAEVDSPDLHIRGEDLQGLQIQLNVQNHRGEVSLKSQLEQTQVTAKGHVDLSGQYQSDLSLDTGTVSISPILQRYVSSQAAAVGGQLQLHAHISGPLKQPEQLAGQAEITNVNLALAKDVQLSNPQPMRFEYRNRVLSIQNASLAGGGTNVSVSGSVPIQSSGQLNANAQGTLDLKALETFAAGATSTGQIKLELQAHGTWEAPQYQGSINISNAGFTSDSMPVGIESMNGTLSLTGRHIEVQKLTAVAGGGQLTVGGGGNFGASPSYAFTVAAKSTRIRQNGTRAMVDADLTLNGAGEQPTIAGRILVHKLSFNQGSDLAEIIAGFSGSDTVTQPSPFEEKVKLNVAVASDEQLALASSQLSIAGSANLRVTGTVADPIILGRIGLTSGEVFFMGKRFEIQNGTIVFANATRTAPVINLAATTTIEQYNITINLAGTMDKLKTTYTSDPTLPTADIINLLAFGQTTTEAASNATPATLGAESAVANAVGSQVAGRLQKVTGISQLTIDPLATAANSQNPGAQIAVQQRVTGNLLVTFSTDVTSAQAQAVQVKYQAKRNVTISILRDENGGYGIDIRYHKTF